MRQARREGAMGKEQEDRTGAGVPEPPPATQPTTTHFYGPPTVGKGALTWSPRPPWGWAADERYVPPPGEHQPPQRPNEDRALTSLGRRLLAAGRVTRAGRVLHRP